MILFTGVFLTAVPIIHCYLDPGSGSILLQLLIASLAGAGIFIGTAWAKLKRYFKKDKNVLLVEGDEEEDDD